MPSLQRTPLHSVHQRLGARLVPFAGYELPLQYSSVIKEHHTVRNAAGLFDVSHMGEIGLSGSGAGVALDRLVATQMLDLEVEEARYSVACNDRGGILDDLIVYRRDVNDYLVVCNASNHSKIFEHFKSTATSSDCSVEDLTESYALIAVQGPASFELLRRAEASPTILDLSRFKLASGSIGPHGCLVARTGYTGEDGVEVFSPANDAPALFERLLELGAELDAGPAGLGARDTLRLEAALSLYGNDISEETNPFEAGLGWLVRKDLHGFVGAGALRELRSRPATRRLVGFEMTGRGGSARPGYAIHSVKASSSDAGEGSPIGQVTSGSIAPTLGKHIGLGYVPPDHAATGSELDIELKGRGKRVRARVVKRPFYRRPKQ